MAIITSRLALSGTAALAGLLLAGCNTTVDETDRAEVLSLCTTGLASTPLSETARSSACNCFADGLIEAKITADDQEKANAIMMECAQKAMADGGMTPAVPAAAPAAPAQ